MFGSDKALPPPLWLSVVMTLAGGWLLFSGVRLALRRENGLCDAFLGAAVLVTSFFLIRHANLYPPITEKLEPLTALLWEGMKGSYELAGKILQAIGSFDIDRLSD